MRYDFSHQLFPVDLPDVIEDLIYLFTYDQTQAELQFRSHRARQTTKLMPVPPRWKNLLTEGRFDWCKYLSGEHVICIEAVKCAVRYINWHCLRSKKCPIARFALISTKTSLCRSLSCFWTRENTVIMIWLLLSVCSIDDFRVGAFHGAGYNEFCRIPPFTHPLSKYYPLRLCEIPVVPTLIRYLLEFTIE